MGSFPDGARVFGCWEVKGLLWRGRRSEVYELRRTDLDVTYRCAMKVVPVRREDSPPGDYPPAARRAIWEQFIMTRLKGCSHLVSYEDHTVVPHQDNGGWDFLIRMELLSPLLPLREERTLTCADVAALGIDICRGLEVCQRNGIFHRDIKPRNLFRTHYGSWKLGDFGLSCFAADCPAQRVGTVGYMAPEVYQGDSYSYCAEVYSLGLSLYYLLNAERLPFCSAHDGDERHAWERRLSGEPLPRPVYGSDGLWAAVTRACAFPRAERFASARGLRNALEDCLSREDDREFIIRPIQPPPCAHTQGITIQ